MPQYIYGRNTVISALKENKVKRLYLQSGFSFGPLLDLLKKNKLEVVYKNENELKKLSNNGVHQGCVAEIADFAYVGLDELIAKGKKKNGFPLLVMLDGIKDPHNLGAILRSADAFGADGVIVKKTEQAPLNMTVAKVSTGAIDFVKVAQVSNLSNAIKKLKDEGYWIVASDGSAKTDYTKIDYKCPIVLVVGSEGEGVSRLVLENSDFITKIDMIGHVNSLNASVATAIYLAQIHYNRSPK
ncbi:MAG: 23S rRNA (guanosine(2251)-2'-O)-methyltransferase RlmB [Bacilli bacterium]|nr:23S rRNA (guanosine(2251)-2'-O)-methyltransferase RlmB [Bacilli bacterium]